MFNTLQAIEIALGMETRGIELYTRAARIVRTDELKRLLLSLADDEKAHSVQFRRMLEKNAPDASGDELLSAIAADIAFPGGLFRAAADGKLENERNLLEYAMEGERGSISFYTELLNGTDEEPVRKVLSDIIRQEQGHLKQLAERHG